MRMSGHMGEGSTQQMRPRRRKKFCNHMSNRSVISSVRRVYHPVENQGTTSAALRLKPNALLRIPG